MHTFLKFDMSMVLNRAFKEIGQRQVEYTQNIMICSSFTGSENTLLTSFMHCKVCVEEHFFTCNSESRFGMNNIMIMHALVNSNIRNLVATIIIEHKSYISQIQIQTVDLNYMKKIGQRRHFWNSLKTSK